MEDSDFERLAAFHEAAHFVLREHLPRARKVDVISILPTALERGSCIGRGALSIPRGVRLTPADESLLIQEAMCSLAGAVTEARTMGYLCPERSRDDCEMVELIIEGLAIENPVARENLGRELWRLTGNHVAAFWGEIERVASLLLRRKTVTGAEARRFLAGRGPKGRKGRKSSRGAGSAGKKGHRMPQDGRTEPPRYSNTLENRPGPTGREMGKASPKDKKGWKRKSGQRS